MKGLNFMSVEVKEIKIRNLNLDTYLELKKEAEYTNLSINTIIKKIIEESIESRKLDNISSELADRLNIQEQALETMCQNILEVNYKLAILISLMNSVFEFEEDDVG
ncbi:hypothetical protein D9V14_08560 [Staphylococcus epidermidis]|jgi:flagellar motility protein MotE (MotC chaperone)|uniref:Uncharacterized protein n=6 Tax=root TaxID=1 RepID=A0A0H2VIF5_STAES|nr:hypothetical protein [Staphylococcus epidermidis]AAO05084.1 hypothetical protein SE_1485 [Staphylococcus epidermidis ATCC 12228]ESR06183.1 hypothetical protein M462_0210785 [Staphylococcus epidermidis CIM28]ESR27916.1 hypothetical protein M452_0201425 [Staphylococcus epidermidis APO35]ESU02734.1 hypothetical protein M461_0212595 [Staphylococcus epidermidis CIM37]ESV09783.1 hypothetical protein M456_0207720 [Staphylococcus epidermidis MC28]ESV15043.1 hypothetical protein M463_0200630 [Staph